MVGEVGLTGDEEALDVGLQVVVDPQATHDVVHGGVDAHRHLVGVLTRDPLVHVEEVVVLLAHRVLAQTLDRVGEVEVDAAAEVADHRAHAATLVADVLGLAGGDVAGDQVAEGGVDPLQVVVAVLLGDVARVLGAVLGLLRHPDATVVAQRLRHQRQLRLVVAGDRDAGGVDLRVAGVGHVGALAVRTPRGGDVGAHRVGREVEDVAVAARGQHHDVGEVGLDRAGDHVAGDDPAGLAVDDDQLEHLVAGVLRDRAGRDLALHRLVGADQQLLTGLATGVERAGDLHTTERAVVQQTAVLTREGHALRDALVDDVRRDLGEAVDVRLARAVVAALHGVVEEAVRRVAVLLVVLRRVDAALRGDRVRTTRGVLVAEGLHVVAGLAHGGGGRAAGQAGADDDHVELAAVGRVDQPVVHLVRGPAVLDQAGGRLRVDELLALGVVPVRVVGPLLGRGGQDGQAADVGVGCHLGVSLIRWVGGAGGQSMMPSSTEIGTSEKPPATTTASTQPATRARVRATAELVRPRVWKAEKVPWCRCSARAAIATR